MESSKFVDAPILLRTSFNLPFKRGQGVLKGDGLFFEFHGARVGGDSGLKDGDFSEEHLVAVA
jgi:hypothetical protein